MSFYINQWKPRPDAPKPICMSCRKVIENPQTRDQVTHDGECRRAWARERDRRGREIQKKKASRRAQSPNSDKAVK